MSGTDPARCALGFDVGEKWIGVAIGNALSHSARSLLTIDRGQGDALEQVARLVREWTPATLVVGDPLTLAGQTQDATLLARRFARQLQARFGLPVSLVDERSSSREASRRFAEARRHGTAKRKHGSRNDAAAAQIILERWLDAGMPVNDPNDLDD